MLAALMFPALFGLVFLGVPVSFALIVVGAGFGLPFFGWTLGQQLLGRLLEVTSSFAFASVPVFIFMGALLERAGIAERLFAAMRLWLGALPGGLAVATVAMAAVFAATTSIIGAVEVVIGLMAIGPMLRAGYDRGLVAGTITAGGSLGTIIPPSITCVVYGLVAQVPVGDLFAGILLPGLLMVALFLSCIVGRCVLRPQDGPRIGAAERALPLSRKLWITATGLVPAALLVAAVLGSIVAGIASPTEAAAVGALGAALLAAAYGTLDRAMLREALAKTVTVTAMIMLIVFGGMLFSSMFYVHGGGRLIQDLVGDGRLSPMLLVAALLAVVFAAGFVLDWVTTVLLCVPIFSPLLKTAGIDPLWFGVLVLVCIQTSYLTPPMAPALFYLRSVAPPEITYGDMCRGVLPFVVCQAIALALVMAFPWLATWLPNALRAF